MLVIHKTYYDCFTSFKWPRTVKVRELVICNNFISTKIKTKENIPPKAIKTIVPISVGAFCTNILSDSCLNSTIAANGKSTIALAGEMKYNTSIAEGLGSSF